MSVHIVNKNGYFDGALRLWVDPVALCGFSDYNSDVDQAALSRAGYRGGYDPRPNTFCSTCESLVSTWDVIQRCNL